MACYPKAYAEVVLSGFVVVMLPSRVGRIGASRNPSDVVLVGTGILA